MDQGVVIRYDADRGFGFIRSAAHGAEDVFVHASNIRGGGVLKPGQRVRFAAESTSKGPRATLVVPGRAGLTPAMVSALALVVVLVYSAVAFGYYAHWSPFWACFGAINVATFGVFAIDKKRARDQGRRIPERVLLGLAMLGGSPAALMAMTLFRHKIRKPAFLIPFGLIVALQVAGVVWWFASER